MDSIIHPDYFYTGRKRTESLQDDLPQRAEAYFTSLFDKVGDGVLVFLGDLPEEELKKELCRTLGGFRVGKLHARRPLVDMRSATGLNARTAQGGEPGAHVALSAAVPFSLQNRMAFRIACSVLEERPRWRTGGPGRRSRTGWNSSRTSGSPFTSTAGPARRRACLQASPPPDPKPCWTPCTA